MSPVRKTVIMRGTKDRAAPVSAETPRMSILQSEMDRMDERREAREAEEQRLHAFTEDFLHKHVGAEGSRWRGAS